MALQDSIAGTTTRVGQSRVTIAIRRGTFRSEAGPSESHCDLHVGCWRLARFVSKCPRALHNAVLTVVMVAAALFGISNASSDPVEYSIVDLGHLPEYPSCRAFALNDLAQVVGSCTENPSGIGPRMPFIWENGTMVALGVLGEFPWQRPQAINSSGEVVGYVSDNHTYRAAFWSGSSVADLNDLLPGGSGWVLSAAMDINDAGQIVGVGERNGESRGYRLDDGVITDFGALGDTTSGVISINELGQVAGVAEDAEGESHAFLWADGVMTRLGPFDGNYSYATDINDAGQIVGNFGTDDGKSLSWFPFLWEGGVVQYLDAGGTSCSATAINSTGQVVGSCLRFDGFYYHEATLWDAGARYELYDLAHSTEGWQIGLGSPMDISEAGQIVGFGGTLPSNANEHSYLLTPIMCGDGVVVAEEECDDGNTIPGDGCDESCLTEILVPAASRWGMVALTLLMLAGLSVVASRRMRAEA